MFQENLDRNVIIYELWKKGFTIDEISFDTSIPRSTVGYYVRKFNKRARRGDPIVFSVEKEKLTKEEISLITVLKRDQIKKISKWMREGPDAMDKIYKYLSIMKLLKELKREIFPAKDEEKVFVKYSNQLLRQFMGDTEMLPRTVTEKNDSVSDIPKKKKRYEQEVIWTATVNSSRRGY